MAGNRRPSAAQGRLGRPGSVALAAAMLVTVAGCPPDTRRLTPVERIGLPAEDYRSLHLDAAGGIWLGAVGRLTLTDPRGASLAEFAVGEAAFVPRYVGELGGVVYFRAGPYLFAVDPAEPDLLMEPTEVGTGTIALDVRGRFIFRTAEAGTVIAHDPTTLEAIWGWGGVGAAAASLALSPEGDRVYIATEATAGSPDEIVVRDLQTGRILSRSALVEPVEALVSDAAGILYALARGPGPRGTVIALRPRRGELETLWRRGVPGIEPGSAATLELSPSGRFIAVVASRDPPFLELLEAASGASVGRSADPLADAAFGPADDLWILLGGELWRLE